MLIFIYESKKDHPHWDRDQHRKFARIWTRKSAMRDASFVREWQTKYFEDFFDHFGVLSLTANPSNDRMWNEYSDNHRGFCVGFNTVPLFEHLGGGGDVAYSDYLPEIYPTPKHSKAYQHALLVFSKLRKWEYEQEYRTHKFFPNVPSDVERIIQIPSLAFKEIILGKNMTSEVKDDLLNSIPRDMVALTIKDEE